MFLGIEIGGTKLQLGVGSGVGTELVAIARHEVDAKLGAAGILDQIERSAAALLQKYPVERIGIGFGGPVNSQTGVVHKSHQIHGWDNVPLVAWCREMFQVPTVIGNDCDAAALAEARLGAAKEAASMLYVTVGTGVGGGIVVGGKLLGAGRPAVAEIGHLRPGLHDDRPEMTVESFCAGPAIAGAAAARISQQISRPLESLRKNLLRPSRETIRQRMEDVQLTNEEYGADLLERCGGDPDQLTAKIVAQSAADGNEIAREVLDHATQVLGWAIAQVITLVAVEIVVVGGDVSLIGDQFFFAPLRQEVDRYVFPPLLKSFRILPAELGELTVIHGAIALAADAG
jgi:glucokinase